MTQAADSRIPWLAWPFVLLWRIVSFILRLTGRVICAVLGVAVTAIGVTLALSIVGAPLGIALAAFGILLIARALF